MPNSERAAPSSSARAGSWLLACVLAGTGVVIGWLVATGVLALPLPEGVLFGVSALVAVAFLVGAVIWQQMWRRALLIGCFIGTAGSVVLVLLLVVG